MQLPDDDLSDGAFDFEEELAEALMDVKVNYNVPFENSEGNNRTCQDMATNFLKQVQHLKPEELKVLHCFLNELKFHVNEHFGSHYWKNEKPAEIIDVANKMCHSHEKNSETFPLPKETVIDLMHVFFRWMYRWKWTEHKLVKRSSS